MKQSLLKQDIVQQTIAYCGSGGVCEENRAFGFVPAFMDRETGRIHLSCNADGVPAIRHQLERVPHDWVVSRDDEGKPAAIKGSVVVGFVRGGRFYSREQTAQLIQWELDKLESL